MQEQGTPAPVAEAPAVETEVVAEGTIVEAAPASEGEQPPEKVEEQPKVEEKPSEADQRLAQKFAALSRKEKQIRDRERQMQSQMAQLQQQLEALKAQQSEVEKYKSMPERLRKQPAEVLKEAGITSEQLTEMLLNGGKPTADMERSELESKVMSEVQALRKYIEEKEAKEAAERLEAATQGFQAEIVDFVNKTEDYELIRANNGTDLVYNVIESHFEQTQNETGKGEILSIKEAADLVENYYLEEAKKLLDRNKVKKLVQPQTPPPAPKGKSAPTLSNTQAARVPTNGAQKLSNEESLAAAAKLIRWED